ncbi:MAG TPA: hypothetical protein VFT85_00690 [Acidimicrobiia bacterium]|nr:hypothetical protein [Acidimicrobiia bacterium]
MSYRFAVLGDPVEHSRSPQLHGAMLDIAGLEGTYEKVRADESVLATAVEGLRKGEWDGLNITMPLKAEAARLADTLSATAARSGSVNTLLRAGEQISGESTDSVAFNEILQLPRFDERTSVLVLGTGGSAAAALAALGDEPNVYVSGRNEGKVEGLSSRLGGDPVGWGSAVAGALVINATSLGMGDETLPTGVLELASGLVDLPYGAQETPAVTSAKALGLALVDGHEFLLRQALASFALWTGVSLSLETLSTRLRNT